LDNGRMHELEQMPKEISAFALTALPYTGGDLRFLGLPNCQSTVSNRP
jgi:hypothetical protein